MCLFFKDLRRAIAINPKVLIDVSTISNTTHDAVTYLLALLYSIPNLSERIVRGNFPDDEELKRKWQETGFLSHVVADRAVAINNVGSLMQAKGHTQEPEQIRTTIVQAVSQLIGHELRKTSRVDKAALVITTKINALCKDLSLNVYEHGATSDTATCWWWLSIQPDFERKKLSVCIADAGVGIMESRPVKKYRRELGLIGATGQLMMEIFQTDESLLHRAILGDVHFTREENSLHRGNGLKSVGRMVSQQHLENMTVLTNKVRGNVGTSRFEPLSNSIQGTVYIFETFSEFWVET
jgi:hypothetical protein